MFCCTHSNLKLPGDCALRVPVHSINRADSLRPGTSASRSGQTHGDDPRIGEGFVGWKPPTGSDSTPGSVDFSICPHVDHELLPENSMAAAERWAAAISGPAYAIDDQTAIRVVDGDVEVISEGHWKLFGP